MYISHSQNNGINGSHCQNIVRYLPQCLHHLRLPLDSFWRKRQSNTNKRTLIDLCITNSPKKIVNSGVLHLFISDHSLVFMTRKSRYERTQVHRVIETRVFKDFNKNQLLHDLAQQPWDSATGRYVANLEKASHGNF